MLTHKINFSRLIRQLLPHHKVLPNRTSWLGALLAPLQELFEEFNLYREDTRKLVRANSQMMIIENYLRDKYNTQSISLESYDDDALLIGFEEEGVGVYFALSDVDGDAVDISLEGEKREAFDGVDFIVYIPSSVLMTDIVAEIEQLKLANMKYEIIQQ